MQDIKSALIYIYILATVLGGVYIYMLMSKTVIKEPPKADVNAWTGVAVENILDYQFSDDNRPLVIHKDMFTKSSPWIGGYDIGIGKTIISKADKNKS